MATARTRTTKPRAVSSVSDKPAGVAMNLDTLERERTPEPFVVVLDGQRLEFNDPQEIDWQDLMELDNPEEFARLCLAEDQREHFLDTKIPAWKMARLMQGFRDHYGMVDPGNSGA